VSGHGVGAVETPGPWSEFHTADVSGFGFGTVRECGEPLFHLYSGTPEQITDVVAKLNGHAALLARERELREAAELALEAFDSAPSHFSRDNVKAIAALREALALSRGGPQL
jgi:hypothetical protein